MPELKKKKKKKNTEKILASISEKSNAPDLGDKRRKE